MVMTYSGLRIIRKYGQIKVLDTFFYDPSATDIQKALQLKRASEKSRLAKKLNSK